MSRPESNIRIIDTNLLLVFFFGLYDKTKISSNTTTSSYNEQDFEIIENLFFYSDSIYVTPQILAEITNINPKLKEPGFSSYFSNLLSKIIQTKENHISKNIMLKEEKLLSRIGFTDLSIIKTAKKLNAEVITSDIPLYVECLKLGIDSRNFNHIRQKVWKL